MKIIGLTGNSGCGKGAVSEIMRENGACIIDCDKIAHKNMEPFGIAYNDIVNAFGTTVLNSDGTINRKALGAIVFNDKKSLELLNSITHKYIRFAVKAEIEKEKGIIVIDAPLLKEAKLDDMCDSIWAVYAPVELRIKRVMERDGIDREAALMRFKNQMSFDEIKAYADVIIENSGSLDELRERVLKNMKNEGLIDV